MLVKSSTIDLEGTDAQVRVNRDRKTAYLSYNPADAELKDSLAHESLHILIDEIDEVVETMLAASSLPPAVTEALNKSYKSHREQVIDRLAKILAEVV